MARPVKYQLTLSQLAEFDDLLTDALVDRVFYWTKIRKMKHTYHPNRRIKTEDVTKIIIHEVVQNKNIAGALQRFLDLNGVKQYLNKVSGKSPEAQADFRKHARRYISMYSPDAGFEVGSTNRYNPLSPEASVVARRVFTRGDTVKFLTGVMAPMSSAEEDEFAAGQTDFSIIYSSRVGGMSLLLGPARFVNHDCEPNCKFVTTNKENVTLYVERKIEIGEEITVNYAEDYFGEGNKECLCRTCEVQMRNGWAGDAASVMSDEEIDIDSLVPGAIVTRRSSRKRQSYSTSLEVPVESFDRKRGGRKAASGAILSPPDSDRGTSVEFGNSATPSVMGGASATPSVIGGPGTPSQSHSPAPEDQVKPVTPPETNGTATPAGNIAGEEQLIKVVEDTAAASDAIAESLLALPGVLDESTIQAEEEGAPTPQETDTNSPQSTIPDCPPEQHPTHPLTASPDFQKSFGLSAPLSALTVVSSSLNIPAPLPEDEELSDFTDIDDDDLDDRILTALLPAPRKKSKRSLPPPTPALIEPPRTRVPGDYLSWHLNTEGTKCVCSDCKKTFVHDDRWYVPRACKRCERHSKIYGLVWPKTVKRKNDSEEQIDDHRLIQRYVTASEHRKEQRKLVEKTAAAEAGRAKRRASYNPYNVPPKDRKRKRDVEEEMEDIDGVFDALKRRGGGKRSKLEAEVIR